MIKRKHEVEAAFSNSRFHHRLRDVQTCCRKVHQRHDISCTTACQTRSLHTNTHNTVGLLSHQVMREFQVILTVYLVGTCFTSGNNCRISVPNLPR